MKKKLLAYWSLICPFCITGRKYPDSAIGKMVTKHWEKGCPVREAYLEVFEKRNQEVKKIGS